MPRKRQIDPSIWSSEQFCNLKDNGPRLLFIGMFSNADDTGRLKASPTYLKTIIFPADEISAEIVEKWRNSICSQQLINLYKVDDIEYLEIPKFPIHQYISKPYPSKIPEPFPNRSRTVPVCANTNINKKEDSIFINERNTLNDIDNDECRNGTGMELLKTTDITIDGGELVDIVTFWTRVTGDLKKRVSASNYKTWIDGMVCQGINSNVVHVSVKSEFVLDGIKRSTHIIEKSICEVMGHPYTVKLSIDADPDALTYFDTVTEAVCGEYMITRDDLVSHAKPQHLVNARREVCKQMMATGKITVSELGRRLNRDHGTIINLLKGVE